MSTQFVAFKITVLKEIRIAWAFLGFKCFRKQFVYFRFDDLILILNYFIKLFQILDLSLGS